MYKAGLQIARRVPQPHSKISLPDPLRYEIIIFFRLELSYYLSFEEIRCDESHRNFLLQLTVLVTGANGFLGSVLVEKLLRCFEVKKIYILMRSKAKKSVEERMQEFLKLRIFDEIRRKDSNQFLKFVAVEVDYSLPDLNIEPELLRKIKKEVEVSFRKRRKIIF